jgi:hypothetical protein
MMDLISWAAQEFFKGEEGCHPSLLLLFENMRVLAGG